MLILYLLSTSKVCSYFHSEALPQADPLTGVMDMNFLEPGFIIATICNKQ